MKIDPYKHKEKYLSWKEKNKELIAKITPENSDITQKSSVIRISEGSDCSESPTIRSSGSPSFPSILKLLQFDVLTLVKSQGKMV
ncbi:MAG: hypothetical protein AABX85_02340 [Nanoarchaeota archaeon]